MAELSDAARRHLRTRLLRQERVIGTFVQLQDPSTIEILGLAGFDFAILDLEHGGLTQADVRPAVRAADRVGLPLIVRVGRQGLGLASQTLDQGVGGMLLAQAETVADAQEITNASRYPPHGQRGACPGIRASDFGWIPWPEHVGRANEQVIVGVAIEGPTAIARLDEIIDVDGLDLVFVGVFDLAKELGHPGDIEHRDVVAAVEQVATTTRKQGIAVGTWAPDMASAKRWLDVGVNFVTVATDILLWRLACLQVIREWQTITSAEPSASLPIAALPLSD